MMEWAEFIQQIIGHSLIYSVAVWNLILGVWLILKWVKKNIKFEKNQVFNVESSHDFQQQKTNDFVQKNKNNLGPVEIEVKKDIFIDKVDKSDIKTDSIVKGKVKTQKDKLKQLRKR